MSKSDVKQDVIEPVTNRQPEFANEVQWNVRKITFREGVQERDTMGAQSVMAWSPRKSFPPSGSQRESMILDVRPGVYVRHDRIIVPWPTIVQIVLEPVS